MDVTISATAGIRSQATRVLVHPAVWVLGTLITVSVVGRSILAWRHSTSRYFPDEYIYTALSRSIGHGSLTIRGHVAHFPGLLEPLVAAPLWGFFSTETAYRLVQAENALAASLAVIPIYMIARDLKLSRNYAYLCCLYALVIPMLVMIPFTISDFVGYPLALGAIAAAVKAIDRPSPKRQLVFLAFATLATLARVEYFVLVPAYLVAAIVIERRNFFRTQRTALLALLPVAAGVLVAATGYYSAVPTAAFHPAVFTWIPLQAFLLSLVAGVFMVPGAVAGLIRPGGGARSAFALVTGCDGGPGDRPDERGRRGLRLLQGALPVLPAAARSARLRGLSRAWEAVSVRRLRSRGRDRDRGCPASRFPATPAGSGSTTRSH